MADESEHLHIVKSQWDVLCYRQNEPSAPAARIPTPDPSAAWAPPGRPASRRWERGEVIPRKRMRRKLARQLGVTEEELAFEGDDG